MLSVKIRAICLDGLSKPTMKTEKIIKGTVWRQSQPFQGRVVIKCPEGRLNCVPLQLPHLLWFPCHSTSRVLLSSCLPYLEFPISIPMTKLQASFNLDFSLYHLLTSHFSSLAVIREKFCFILANNYVCFYYLYGCNSLSE